MQRTLKKTPEDNPPVFLNQKSYSNATQLERSLSRFQKPQTEPFLQSIKRLLGRVDHLDLRPRPAGRYLSTLLTNLPEEALLKVLSKLKVNDIINLSQTCQAHHVLVHALKCLHFAAYLADPNELLWVKLKLLLDVARVPPREVVNPTNVSALRHLTLAILFLQALPEKSTIFLKLKTQLQKQIPNGPLFKNSLQLTTELFDPRWESYVQWFRTLGAEGKEDRNLLNRLGARKIESQYEQNFCNEKPYSLIFHFRPLFPSTQGGLNLMKSLIADLTRFSDLPLQMPKHAEQFLRQRSYPERDTVSLIREKPMLLDFMPSPYQVLQIAPPHTDDPMATDQPPVSKKDASHQDQTSFTQSDQKRLFQPSIKVAVYSERLPEGQEARAFPTKPYLTFNPNQTVIDVSTRLSGYRRPQLWCILMYKIAWRRAVTIEKNPLAQGFLNKVTDLFKEMLNDPVYHHAKSKDPMLSAVGNFYEQLCNSPNILKVNVNLVMDKEVENASERPSSWIYRPDPEYAEKHVKNKLAWFWYRAEKLFSYVITLPDQFGKNLTANEFERRTPVESSVPQPRSTPSIKSRLEFPSSKPAEERIFPPSVLSQQVQQLAPKTSLIPDTAATVAPVPMVSSVLTPPQPTQVRPLPAGYQTFSSSLPSSMPHITARSFETLEYPNIVRQEDAVTFAHPLSSAQRNLTWNQEIHLLDFAHRQVIITRMHNLHPQGLMTIRTEYVDWHTYQTMDYATNPVATRLTVTFPPAYYTTDSTPDGAY